MSTDHTDAHWGVIPNDHVELTDAQYVSAMADEVEASWMMNVPEVKKHLGRLRGIAAALASPTVAPADERVTSGTKLWLWKNGDHFLAFTNLYPCFSPGGDPMILGEPAAWAEFRESHDRASLDQPHSGETPT